MVPDASAGGVKGEVAGVFTVQLLQVRPSAEVLKEELVLICRRYTTIDPGTLPQVSWGEVDTPAEPLAGAVSAGAASVAANVGKG